MSLPLSRIAEFGGVQKPGDDLFPAEASVGKPTSRLTSQFTHTNKWPLLP